MVILCTLHEILLPGPFLSRSMKSLLSSFVCTSPFLPRQGPTTMAPQTRRFRHALSMNVRSDRILDGHAEHKGAYLWATFPSSHLEIFAASSSSCSANTSLSVAIAKPKEVAIPLYIHINKVDFAESRFLVSALIFFSIAMVLISRGAELVATMRCVHSLSRTDSDLSGTVFLQPCNLVLMLKGCILNTFVSLGIR